MDKGVWRTTVHEVTRSWTYWASNAQTQVILSWPVSPEGQPSLLGSNLVAAHLFNSISNAFKCRRYNDSEGKALYNLDVI